MFYDHEILTNRHYGVATIWLVATLGAKSNLKKVTRRAILDVDLLKACKTITEPEQPLALRLQGSLLFGVSRVFQQQCGYVLTDVTSLRDNMRNKPVVQEMELDPGVGKTRPEQLNLANDPFFMPDLDISFDLSAFGFSSSSSSPSRADSSQLSLASSQSSIHASEEEEEGLEIPDYSTPSGGAGGCDVALGAVASSLAESDNRAPHVPAVFDEEPAIFDEPLFDVGDDGALHPALPGGDLDDYQLPSIEDDGLAAEAGLASEAGLSGRADTGLDARFGDDEPMLNFDDDPLTIGGHQPPQLPAAPLIPLTPEPELGDEEAANQNDPLAQIEDEESSETAKAPQRGARQPKAIRPDQQTELNNRDLTEWDQNYLGNMAAASRLKQSHVAPSKAKKNAEFWILQQGLGNVMTAFGKDNVEHPLAIFSGQSLWDLLRGPVVGTKRSRSRSDVGEEEDDERHVRARTGSCENVAREEPDDNGIQHIDDDPMFVGDDFDVEPEVGRHAAPSLPDISSGMPWNISGSRQSSARPFGSAAIAGMTSTVGGLSGGMDLGSLPGLRSRRGSRLTSASPLFGRGLPSLSRHSSQGPLDPSMLTSNEDDLAELDAQLGADLDPDFELYGPSATVDTQTAAQSQWVQATLENEAYNFLTFVSTKLQENVGFGGDEETNGDEHITMDELLPPTQNSAIVGAQALLHILALTTKGLLQVQQDEHFGDIQIAVVAH